MAAQPRKTGRTGLLLRRNLYFLFFLAYFTVATGGMLFAGKREVFPVFSWSLFTQVSQYQWTYEIAISRIDDTVYEPPVDFFALKAKFAVARQRDSAVVKSAHAYHRASQGDQAELDTIRAVIEGRYLSGYARVDYTILHVLHDPVRRWQTGEIERRDVIAELSTAGRQ